jgi:type IV pilus assembly protein PilW
MHPDPGVAMRRAASFRAQRGRTLIEILVAITIGLMLSVGILSIFSANRQTYRASSDLQRMQAAGQLALDRLAYQVRMAGYGQIIGDFTTVSQPTSFVGNPVWACTGGFSDPREATETPACVNDANRPDSLQIRYQVETAAVAGSGESRDCLGFEVPPDGAGLRTAQNRFYIAASNGAPTLMCAGNGLAPAPLIPNVEDMQIKVRVGAPFSRVERTLDPDLVTDWGRVLGVEICVQIISEGTGLVDTGTQAGTGCRGAFPTDGRLRRTFTQVVTLRNRIM